jgi:anti-anti-sigma factor
MEMQNFVTGDVVEIRIRGRIDGDAANLLEEEILKLRSKASAIYVNLSEATFLCSAGLRVLLQYWRSMKNVNKVLQVTTPSAEVDSVLSTTGFRQSLVEH